MLTTRALLSGQAESRSRELAADVTHAGRPEFLEGHGCLSSARRSTLALMRKAALAVLFAALLAPSLASAQNAWIEADPFNMPMPQLVAIERWDRWGGRVPEPSSVSYSGVDRIKIFFSEGSMNLSLSLIPDKSYFLILRPKASSQRVTAPIDAPSKSSVPMSGESPKLP